MYQSIDLHTKSSLFKKLVPASVLKEISFTYLRLPVLGVNQNGYRIATAIFYQILGEKLPPKLVESVEKYRTKIKNRISQRVFLEDCDDVIA